MTDKALRPDGAIGRLDGGDQILFAPHKLACKATGRIVLHPGFADALAWLRMALGKPMIVTSCCRSAEHNRAVGGHPRSLHIYDRPQHPGQRGTLAIDIARRAPAYNVHLASLALSLGWSIGVARGFFHLDRRDFIDLPRNVFGYGR